MNNMGKDIRAKINNRLLNQMDFSNYEILVATLYGNEYRI